MNKKLPQKLSLLSPIDFDENELIEIQDQPIPFTKIPVYVEFLLMKNVSHTTALIYGLFSIFKDSGVVWMTNERIGQIIRNTILGVDMSPQKISTHVSKLKKMGLVETKIIFNPQTEKSKRYIQFLGFDNLNDDYKTEAFIKYMKQKTDLTRKLNHPPTDLTIPLNPPDLTKPLNVEYNNNVSNYMRKEINININKRDFSNLKGIKDRYIEKWNELEGTQKHKNPNTAVYKKAKKLIQQLKDGSIWKYNKLSDEFIEKHKITPELLQKKWTPKEILINIENLSKLFINGYWPKDKSKLPKSLPDLIFNSNSCCSQFLLCHIHPPQLLSEQRASKFNDKFPLLSPEVHEFFEIKSYSEKIKMQEYIQQWMDTHEKRFPQERPYVASKFRTGYYAIREYIEWLKDEMAWLGSQKKNISLMKIGCDRYNKWYKSEKENWTEDGYDSDGWNTNDYEGDDEGDEVVEA